MLKHKILKLLMRLPDSEFEHYVQVDDRNSNVTLFTFAGAAGLFGMTPIFEFRRLLSERGGDYNLVFFRDLHSLCYHLDPQGNPNGLEFFANEIHHLIARLGSSYNVAIGNSAGAGAALYFGARCHLDQVIAFGAFLPEREDLKTRWRAIADYRLLFQSPIAYTMGISGVNVHRKLRRSVGPQGIWPIVEMWQAETPLPKAVMYYGEGCEGDRLTAQQFCDTGHVECVALPTKSHGAARYLKSRGQLGSVIINHIHKGLAERELKTMEA